MRFVRHDDQGASAVEYALLLTAIAAVIVVVIFALGNAVTGLYSDTCTRIDDQVTASSSC